MPLYLNVDKRTAIQMINDLVKIGAEIDQEWNVRYQNARNSGWEKPEIQNGLFEYCKTTTTNWLNLAKNSFSQIYESPDSKWQSFLNPNLGIPGYPAGMNVQFAAYSAKLKDRMTILSRLITQLETNEISTNINVSNSHGIIINTGTISGNINNNVTKIQNQGNADLANALKALTQVVLKEHSDEIDIELMLKQIEILSQEALKPLSEQKKTKLKAAWDYINAFSSITSIGTFIVEYGPAIAKFFNF